MGAAKAWLACGRERLLQRVVRIVSETVSPVVVAGRSGQDLPSLPEDVCVVEDAIEDAGPLAGIAAGLSALSASCDAAVVVACDHLLLRPAFLERLVLMSSDVDAVVPGDRQRLYPLLAIYGLHVRSIVQEMLASGERRAQALPERCGAKIVPADEFRDVDPNLDSLINVNHAEEFERALRELDVC